MSNPTKLTERLIEIKKQIEVAERDKAQAEGKLQVCMARLKDEYGCKSIAEAEKKLKTLKEEEDALSKDIDTKMTRLREEFGM
jgi:cyanate lyase